LFAGSEEGRGVLWPALLVEVDCQEETGLVLEHGIDARDERPTRVVLPGQVPPDHVVGDRKKSAVRAFRTLDPRLFTDASNPFVRAGRCIAGFTCSAAFEASRIDVVASPARPRKSERKRAIFASGAESWCTRSVPETFVLPVSGK
jgi:hypothetical protein